MDQELRYKLLQKAAMVTVVVNIVLTIVKLVAGFASGSMAVLSDGVHTLSDVFTTVMVMVGLKLSNQKADEEHPYGHQRIESVVSMFLAFMLGMTALFLGYQGIQKIFHGTSGMPTLLALVATAGSILVKEWMFWYARGVAKQCGSTSLMSDAWHHRSDAISSVAVLIGVGGSCLGLWFMEPVATIVVCSIILKAAFDIGKAAVIQLVDHAADDEACTAIQKIAQSVNGVEGIDHLRTRLSNNIIFVDIEVVVSPDITVAQGHTIAERVHDLVEASSLPIGHCMVHVHPQE